MESTMNRETQERMKALQMSDLGSERREFISTREDKRYGQRYSCEELEAFRAFRKPKTASGRQAQAHQPALTAWSSLAQKVNDTDSLERLDPLMHGQSHRARLMEKIQEQGGQQYGEGYGKNSQSKPENHYPFSPVSSGRGGGIIGTRGRGRGIGPRGAPGPIAMRSHSVVLPAGHALTRQDPALDSNNGGPVTLEKNHRGARGRGPRGQPTRPTPRLRRAAAMEDYSKNLVSSAEFMKTAQVQGYTKPDSQVSLGYPPRVSTSPARRHSPSRSVSPCQRSVTLAGPVARPPLPPLCPKAVKQEKPEQPHVPTTTLKPFAPVPKLSIPASNPILKDSLGQPLLQAKIQNTICPIPKPSVTKTKFAPKDSPPGPSEDILLIDFSSEDEIPKPQPGPSTMASPKVPTGALLDLLDSEDMPGPGPLTPNKSRLSEAVEHQLSGLEFIKTVPVKLSDADYENLPQELQTVTSTATDIVPPGSKKSQAGSFVEHRSPQNSLSSGDSTQRAKETLPEENLSPRKAGPTVSEPSLIGFEKLQISEPPGLEFLANEPQTAAARTQQNEQDVHPAPKHGGIGMLADSIHAIDVIHARIIGGARTIGVKPSHTTKINNEVTIEIQRASRIQSRMPSGISTPINQPSGLAASIYATDQKFDAASTTVSKPRQASFRSHHRLA
ncbi:unnamed protein product [Penicillium manginii]